MNANRANQQSISARTGAALIGSAAIAVAIGVLGATPPTTTGRTRRPSPIRAAGTP